MTTLQGDELNLLLQECKTLTRILKHLTERIKFSIYKSDSEECRSITVSSESDDEPPILPNAFLDTPSYLDTEEDMA